MRLSLRRVAVSVVLLGATAVVVACGSSTSKSSVKAGGGAKSDCVATSGSVTRVAGAYTMVATLGPSEMMYTQAEVAKQHPKSGEVMLGGSMGSGPLATTPMQPGGPTHGNDVTSTTGMGGNHTLATTPMQGGGGSQPGNDISTTTAMGGKGMDTTTPMTAAPGAATGSTTSPMMSDGGNAATRHLEVHVCTTATGKVVSNANPTITVRDQMGGASSPVDVAVMQGIGAGRGDIHYGNNVPVKPGDDYVVTVKLGRAVGTFTLKA